MTPPEFWTQGGWQATALAPLGCLYALGGAARLRFGASFDAGVPTICVGNLTLGGAGKTPTVLALAERLVARGRRVGVLSRGHGGTAPGPLRVYPDAHDASLVGDEPLLLARAAPTWVAKRRAQAAYAALTENVDCLLLDDGFQSPALRKTLSFVVVDGGSGLGNGRVFPAGPLREPAAWGLARARAIVLIGADETGFERAHGAGRKILRARLEPDSRALAGAAVFAFAGIGRPAKFFASLRALGCEIAGTRAFADHHPYSRAELEGLLREAGAAKPVTTEKDLVRIPADLRGRFEALKIRLVFDDPASLDAILAEALA
jgi:tetraacyldisaccharide 4'-kinase